MCKFTCDEFIHLFVCVSENAFSLYLWKMVLLVIANVDWLVVFVSLCFYVLFFLKCFWDLLCMLHLYVCSIHYILKHCFFKYFFSSPPLFFYGLHFHIYIRALKIDPQLIALFSLCVSFWLFSIAVFPNSWIFSFIMYNLH